jgi:hypothetical protein
MFDITSGPKKDPKIIRLVKNTDWDKFNNILAESDFLNNNDIELNNTSKIDEVVETLNSTLQQAFEEACPQLKSLAPSVNLRGSLLNYRSRPDIRSGLIRSGIRLIFDPVRSRPVSRRKLAGTGSQVLIF